MTTRTAPMQTDRETEQARAQKVIRQPTGGFRVDAVAHGLPLSEQGRTRGVNCLSRFFFGSVNVRRVVCTRQRRRRELAAEQTTFFTARTSFASAFARGHSSALGTRSDFLELEAAHSTVFFCRGAARAFSRQELANGEENA